MATSECTPGSERTSPDVPRAAAILDLALRELAESPPPEMSATDLRRVIWKHIFQARDLLREDPVGTWPSDPDGYMAAVARERGLRVSREFTQPRASES